MNRMTTGIYIYPWDLDTACASTVEEIAGLGLDAVVINAGYHHGRFLRPRARSFALLEEAAISFLPEEKRYGDMVPFVHEKIARANTIQNTRTIALSNGLDFQIWLVLLHNSSLGARHPEICSQNVWGDVNIHSLCPSRTKTRAYAYALLGDVCGNLNPSRVSLEAATWLPFAHGHHHEVVMTDIGVIGRYLLSLCFCEACAERMAERGADPNAAKKTTERLLLRCIEKDVGWPEIESGSLAYYFLEFPELYAYEHARRQFLAEFVGKLTETANKDGVALDFIPASFTFPTVQAFWEGVGFRELEGRTDRLNLLTYGPTADSTRHGIRSVANVTNTPLMASLSLKSGLIDSAADLRRRVDILLEENVQAVNFYNYGVMNKERLAWVGEACSHIRRKIAPEGGE